jgi:hypothetical protein
MLTEHRLEAYATLRRRVVTPGARTSKEDVTGIHFSAYLQESHFSVHSDLEERVK